MHQQVEEIGLPLQRRRVAGRRLAALQQPGQPAHRPQGMGVARAVERIQRVGRRREQRPIRPRHPRHAPLQPACPCPGTNRPGVLELLGDGGEPREHGPPFLLGSAGGAALAAVHEQAGAHQAAAEAQDVGPAIVEDVVQGGVVAAVGMLGQVRAPRPLHLLPAAHSLQVREHRPRIGPHPPRGLDPRRPRPALPPAPWHRRRSEPPPPFQPRRTARAGRARSASLPIPRSSGRLPSPPFGIRIHRNRRAASACRRPRRRGWRRQAARCPPATTPRRGDGRRR